MQALSRPSSSNSGDLGLATNDATNNVEPIVNHKVLLEDSDDSKSISTSLPDLTEIGLAKFLTKVSFKEGESSTKIGNVHLFSN